MILLGTTGIDYPHLNYFFPVGTSRLEFYTKNSNLLELQDTFHRTVPSEILKGMHQSTSDDFNFIGRMHKAVTLNPGKDNHEIILRHLSHLDSLEHKMPMIMLNFDKKFIMNSTSLSQLEDMVKYTRQNYVGHILLEFMNGSWFKINDDLKNLLDEYSCSIVNTDQHLVPHQMREKSLFYLRLIGDRSIVPTKLFGKKSIDRSRDIKYWATYIKSISKRHRFVYVVIDNHFSGDSIYDCRSMANELKELKVKFYGFDSK